MLLVIQSCNFLVWVTAVGKTKQNKKKVRENPTYSQWRTNERNCRGKRNSKLFPTYVHMIHQWIYMLSLNCDVRQQLEKAQHILRIYGPCVEEFHSLVRRVRALCVGRFLFVYFERIRHIRGFIKCYSLILKHPWSCIKTRDVLILMIRGLSILCYRFKHLTL